ncbi:hypothetical protein GIB67_039563, partial [Kingdonia uniflora]
MNKHKQRNTQHQDYSGSANCLRSLSRERVYSMSQLQSLKPNFEFPTQEIPQMFSPKDCQKGFRSNDIGSRSNEILRLGQIS